MSPTRDFHGLRANADGLQWRKVEPKGGSGLWGFLNSESAPPGNAISLLAAQLIGIETTSIVVEFYNAALVHYFVTADPTEAAAIDAGAAGPGWVRTGKSWKSGGPNRVCRSYGSTDINPATGLRRGPNSHFFTIDAAECAAVKLDAGWHFESYDYSGWPQVNGSCPDGTTAVLRVYKGRFAQNDSNHRYTIAPPAYSDRM